MSLDTDNSGALNREELAEFVKHMLKGFHGEGKKDEDNAKLDLVFQRLDENNNGAISKDELGDFFRELMKE